MTKKDYQKFADMFRHELILENEGSDADKAIWRIIGNVADLFQVDNPRFDRDRFLRACDVLDSKRLTLSNG